MVFTCQENPRAYYGYHSARYDLRVSVGRGGGGVGGGGGGGGGARMV